jgi:hypothetical protein
VALAVSVPPAVSSVLPSSVGAPAEMLLPLEAPVPGALPDSCTVREVGRGAPMVERTPFKALLGGVTWLGAGVYACAKTEQPTNAAHRTRGPKWARRLVDERILTRARLC